MASPPPGETLSICKHPRRLGVLCCALFVLGIPAAAQAAHSLATAVEQPNASSSELDMAYSRIKGTGEKYVRIVLYWSTVQPSRPAAGTNAGNPSNASYDWAQSDVRVNRALAAGRPRSSPSGARRRRPRTEASTEVSRGRQAERCGLRTPRRRAREALPEGPQVGSVERTEPRSLPDAQIVGGKVYSPRTTGGS